MLRMTTWSAPVRFAEADQQGIAFNAHYLTWCDEAMTAWLREIELPYDGLLARGLDTRLVASALQWAAPVRWGDVVEVDAAAERVGRTSFVVRFEVHVGGRACCTVATTYVLTDLDGLPRPVPDDVRARLTGEPAATLPA